MHLSNYKGVKINEQIVQADVIIKDQNEFKKIVLDTKEMVVFLKESEIKRENESKRQKKYRWFGIIISNIASFILGVGASYTATHMDKEISKMIKDIVAFFSDLIGKM